MRSPAAAEELIKAFVDRTGVRGTCPPRRYLWTDAFAVCTLLQLSHSCGRAGYRDLALTLVDQVHRVLGRHRADDPRQGWISGLGEAEGARHPTRGGLRIGKPLPERETGAAFDERLEWERDGQYLHYLTRWMHALDRVTAVTGDPIYNRWAVELAQTAQARFRFRPADGGAPQLFWKMSVDLSRPLVASTGQHDPLDAFVTYAQLRAGANCGTSGDAPPPLQSELREARMMCRGRPLATSDPLGLGGLLAAACTLAQLERRGQAEGAELLPGVLREIGSGVSRWVVSGALERPAQTRLAFRELGLSIGLRALPMIRTWLDAAPVPASRAALDPSLEVAAAYAPLASTIESFWAAPARRQTRAWLAHEDINTVMLATSLAPELYLADPRALPRRDPD